MTLNDQAISAILIALSSETTANDLKMKLMTSVVYCCMLLQVLIQAILLKGHSLSSKSKDGHSSKHSSISNKHRERHYDKHKSSTSISDKQRSEHSTSWMDTWLSIRLGIQTRIKTEYSKHSSSKSNSHNSSLDKHSSLDKPAHHWTNTIIDTKRKAQ